MPFRRMRSIDLTVPLLLVVGLLMASNPPGFVRERAVEVPVTGMIADPCSGEELVIGGSAQIRARSALSGDGGFQVEVQADLSDAVATNGSGAEHDLGGAATGEGTTYGPFPATLEIGAQGSLVNESSGENLAARLRFHVSVEADGSAAPTGSVEVAALECRF